MGNTNYDKRISLVMDGKLHKQLKDHVEIERMESPEKNMSECVRNILREKFQKLQYQLEVIGHLMPNYDRSQSIRDDVNLKSLELVRMLIESNYRFDETTATPAVIPNVPHPEAKFFAAGSIKYPGKCFRCKGEYAVGVEMFQVQGKGCMHPGCISPEEHTFYLGTPAKFYYNWCIKTGKIERKKAASK